jgi:hypothetical protein
MQIYLPPTEYKQKQIKGKEKYLRGREAVTHSHAPTRKETKET